MSFGIITKWQIHSAAEWTASTQVLNTYEAALESDTGKMKKGDGLNVFSALSYFPGFGGGVGGPETDPVYSAWIAGPPNVSEFTNDAGYITAAGAESDPIFTAWLAGPPNLSEFNDDVGFLTSFTETDPVFTTWLGTNAFLSSSTTSVQDGYFNSLFLKDQITPSHYLNVLLEDNLTSTRLLQISVGDANRSLTLSGSAVLSGTNTGDQSSIVGISGTKAQFDTACSDGNFLYAGDVTQYTDELAQDAVGAMCTDGSLVYVDATPLLTRAALTGDVTAAQGSNATTIANDAVTFAKFQNITDARLLGRSAGSTGDMQEITVGTGLSLAAGALTGTGFSQVVWRVFTTPGAGTYTPTAGMKYCIVIATGGGGASSDCTNTDACTGGGGAGGTAIKVYSAATIAASKPFNIGAGGVRAATAGAGQPTDFASADIIGNGGNGSAVQLVGATVNVGYGGLGANATGGTMNITGGAGSAGVIVSTTLGFGGTGGSSYWGGGGSVVGSDTAGVVGQAYGSGASGAHAASATDRLGANGADGVLVVIEYI